MTQGPGLYILFKRTLSVCFASLICSFLLIEGAWAAVSPPPPPPDPTLGANRISDIANTRHNLGSGGSVNPSAGTSEICVFCHTPHGADTSANAPLWNRQLSSATYDTYGADTLDALDATEGSGNQLPQPAGSSKLCLSCHDGTLAIASGTTILNAPGSGTGSGVSGVNTLSANKNLGTDLTNDHPISVTYDSDLGARDGEMRQLDSNQQYNTYIGRQDDGDFTLPLQSTGAQTEPGQLQCTTCHDPHISGSDAFSTDTPTTTTIKFLRANRFQLEPPNTATTDIVPSDSIICLYCHTKLNNSWKLSAHADPDVADEQYESAAASEREFPTGIRVWEAACLNCHDTHTKSGQTKLLRQNNSGSSAGNQEETCYQCHDLNAGILENGTGSVPNIRDEFDRAIHMPITTGDQANGANSAERHNIQDADFTESASNLGLSTNSRHVECTDCHNPHRVIRNNRFNDPDDTDSIGDGSLRTHTAGLNSTSDGNNDGREGNVASGVLRGAWGVVSQTAGQITSDWRPDTGTFTYDIKKGDPSATSDSYGPESVHMESSHLTREYQLCFKCHSDYAFSTSPPSLDSNGGSTPSGTNGLTAYTNVAAEFTMVEATNPPTSGTDQGEADITSTDACASSATLGTEATTLDCAPHGGLPGNPGRGSGADIDGKKRLNHRSWHPVMFPTGRTRTERTMPTTGSVNLLAPFDDNIGTQTMYCSDCHGDTNSWDPGTGPDTTTVQGPHGSGSNFLLKGTWAPGTSSNTPNSPGFCANCHAPTTRNSGFDGASEAWHGYEDKDDAPCGFCHIAIPHGWKNKAFLVNLYCVGPENGETTGFDSFGCKTKSPRYDAEPYYQQATLMVADWAESGGWAAGDCRGVTWMQDNCGSW